MSKYKELDSVRSPLILSRRRNLTRRNFLGIGTSAAALLGCKTIGSSQVKAQKKQDIAYLAIYPGIGVARVGNNPKADGFYIGPEVSDSLYHTDLATLRDPSNGALNRQAARFRIYAFNEDKEVLREITADEAKIEWTAQVANRKAEWYQFRAALDIPESERNAAMVCPRRNAMIEGEDRKKLIIAPPPQSISGKNAKSGPLLGAFDGSQGAGKVAKPIEVNLGELRTDALGRLLFLGGLGKAGSPLGTPAFNMQDGNSFNNADGWYDDTCDGMISAKVTLGGKTWDADQAWVFVAPPNYAPDVLGWRTLYDLLVEVYVGNGMMPMPPRTSFQKDVLPLFQRLAGLQWVNKGFNEVYGKGKEFDFDDPKIQEKLADNSPANQQYRARLFDHFRIPAQLERSKWPALYGDAFGMVDDFSGSLPNHTLPVDAVRAEHLKRWRDGNFTNDFRPRSQRSFEEWDVQARTGQIPSFDPLATAKISLDDQPDELNRAALDYCLADAFHPGCEITYPMRRATMYRDKFRIRFEKNEDGSFRYRDFGPTLTTDHLRRSDGPFGAQIPGSITQWMAVPWQGDTLFCRSGYFPQYSPYVPAYWPARVPNQVLTERNYRTLMDSAKSADERKTAYLERAHWPRAYVNDQLDKDIEKMVDNFGNMGVVIAMPGPKDLESDVPAVVLVEFHRMPDEGRPETLGTNAPKSDAERKILEAGWPSVEVFEAYKKARRVQ